MKMKIVLELTPVEYGILNKPIINEEDDEQSLLQEIQRNILTENMGIYRLILDVSLFVRIVKYFNEGHWGYWDAGFSVIFSQIKELVDGVLCIYVKNEL